MKRLLIAVVSIVVAGSPGLMKGSAQEGVKASKAARKAGTETEFLVAGMSCDSCALSASKVLKKIPGVRQAKVDFDSKEAVIKSRREISESEVREALATLGFEACFPGDVVPQPLSEEEKAGLDIKTASHGEAIEISQHLAPGKITVFDYYADWCGPCYLLTPKLERLLLKYENLALRQVDISDWESDAAKQATEEFDLPGLPYVRIYGPKGKLLGVVEGNQIEKVEEIIRSPGR